MLVFLSALAGLILAGSVSLALPIVLIVATAFDTTDLLIHLSFVYVTSRIFHYIIKNFIGEYASLGVTSLYGAGAGFVVPMGASVLFFHLIGWTMPFFLVGECLLVLFSVQKLISLINPAALGSQITGISVMILCWLLGIMVFWSIVKSVIIEVPHTSLFLTIICMLELALIPFALKINIDLIGPSCVGLLLVLHVWADINPTQPLFELEVSGKILQYVLDKGLTRRTLMFGVDNLAIYGFYFVNKWSEKEKRPLLVMGLKSILTIGIFYIRLLQRPSSLKYGFYWGMTEFCFAGLAVLLYFFVFQSSGDDFDFGYESDDD